MGVTFDETTQQFVFDFEHDGADDIVSLTGEGPNLQDNPDLTQFIKKAVNQYMLRYIYRFAQPRLREMELILKPNEEMHNLIQENNVLVINDVTTSGSTINEVLRTLRILNEDNDISIFSLIGRKDLMADANLLMINI